MPVNNNSDHHPNFPPNLSITPLASEIQTRSHLTESKYQFGAQAQQEAISRYGIAGRIWEAAHALCVYVDPDDGHEFDPPFADDPRIPLGVIELGSGTGVVASSVAAVIRRAVTPDGFVIATDLPDVCPLLEHNLGVRDSPDGETHTITTSDAVWVRPLAWSNLNHTVAIANELGARRLTHIICSDLVYFPELLGPLLRTFIHITGPPFVSSSGPPIKVVISYKIRSLSKETPFWSAFGLWFSFHPVLPRRQLQSENPPLGKSEPCRQFEADQDADRISIFVAYRRSESVSWRVPEADKELLEGVGARGTSAKKGNDTFETILFMSMRIDSAGK